MPMPNRILNYLLTQKSILYSSKIFLSSLICWYGLKLVGVENPIWSVITVFVVSDPSLTTTLGLAKVRVLNTCVGCLFGLAAIFIFGYSPLISLFAASFTVLVVNMVQRYPVNWRLAPVTVIILMDAGRAATSRAEEFQYVLMRVGEIGFGCAVALLMAGLYTKLARRKTMPDVQSDALTELKPTETE